MSAPSFPQQKNNLRFAFPGQHEYRHHKSNSIANSTRTPSPSPKNENILNDPQNDNVFNEGLASSVLYPLKPPCGCDRYHLPSFSNLINQSSGIFYFSLQMFSLIGTYAWYSSKKDIGSNKFLMSHDHQWILKILTSDKCLSTMVAFQTFGCVILAFNAMNNHSHRT